MAPAFIKSFVGMMPYRDTVLSSGGHDCVCWVPDGSNTCSGGSSLRYCLDYGGDSCGEIEVRRLSVIGYLLPRCSLYRGCNARLKYRFAC